MRDSSWQQELSNWLRLDQTRGVGGETARKLLAHFGLPQCIFETSYSALLPITGERIARALLAEPSGETSALIDKTLEWAQQPGNRALTLADADYPRTLLEIADPPLILYAKGRQELLHASSMAVVGSRNATAQGVLNAEHFSQSLSMAGLTIVSGMALGIDTAAHKGGLRGSGATVAVIGTGADIVYPARNRALAHDIAANGCIVSEYALGTPALSANFPRRNRIISGLSTGILVVEAAAQSGSLITARMAAEQGREVFAIPGSIHSPLSKGCHLLIKQGAKLVECAQDVLEELKILPLEACARQSAESMQRAREAGLAPDTARLLHALGFDPVAPETLATRCRIDIAQLQGQLLALELDGLVEMLPGGMTRRVATP